MSKFRQGGKLRLALLLAFSMLIQIVVPSLLSVTYAMEDEEAVGMEVTVGQAVEEVEIDAETEPGASGDGVGDGTINPDTDDKGDEGALDNSGDKDDDGSDNSGVTGEQQKPGDSDDAKNSDEDGDGQDSQDQQKEDDEEKNGEGTESNDGEGTETSDEKEDKVVDGEEAPDDEDEIEVVNDDEGEENSYQPSAVLSNLVTSFKFSYNNKAGNEWTIVNDEDNIEVDLNDLNAVELIYGLTKPDDVTINAGDTYTIDLPLIYGGSGVENQSIKIDETQVATYSIVDGKVIIIFNENANKFDNVEMSVNLSGSFNTKIFESQEEVVVQVPFSDESSYSATIRPQQQAYDGTDKKEAGSPYILNEDGSKTTTDRNPTHVDWTVRVNDSMGSYESATIVDELGEGLEIVKESFIVKRIVRNYNNEIIGRELVDVQPTITDTDTGFELDLGKIKDAYDITYTTKITRPDGGGTKEINNNARIILGGNRNNVSDNFTGTWSGDLPTINKEGKLSDDPHVINWTVEYNYGKENLGTVTLTDTLTRGELLPNTIKVYEVEPDIDGKVPDLGEPDSGSFPLELDADGKAYYITFSSTVPVGLNEDITNTISDDLPQPNSDEASVPVNTIPTGGKVGEQGVDENGRPYIVWTITMNSEKIDVGSITVRDVFNPKYLEFDVNDTTLFKLYLVDEEGKDKEVSNFNIEYYQYNGEDINLTGYTGFKLDIENAGPKTYKFVYRTYYTEQGMQQPQLANHAELVFEDGAGIGIGDSVGVDFDLNGPKAGISKSGDYELNDEGNQEILWTVNINDSKILLDAGSTITENFISGNYTYIENSLSLKDGSTILNLGEDYSLSVDEDKKGFVIKLLKDTKATLTLTFRTTADDTNNASHENKATLKWQGGEEPATSTVGKRDPGSNKTGTVVINDDGTKTVKWTVNFNTSKNVIHNFKLVDTYTPATVDVSDIKITSGGEDVTGSFTISDEGTSGTFTVTKLKLDAKSYQLTYSTTLSPEEEKLEIKNTAAITYTGGSENPSKSITNPTLVVEKQADGIKKDGKNPVISWTIQANTDSTNKYVNLVNAVLEDTIPKDQKLVKDSISIERVGGGEVTLNVIESNDNYFKIRLPDGPYQYKVTFDTEILQMPSLDPEVFDRYNNSTKLTNQPGVEGLEQTDDANASIRYYKDVDNDLTGKTGEQNSDTENIDYEVTINPEGLTINNAKVVDTLSDNHQYIEDSIQVMDSEGEKLTSGYTLTVADDNRSFELVFKEDSNKEADLGTINSSYKISYSTRLNADLIGTYNVENSIVLTGGTNNTELKKTETRTSSQQWFYGGGGSGRLLDFKFNKITPNNTHLSGAKFTLERVDFNGDRTVVRDSITTAGNTINFNDYRAGRYILTETAAPEGYTKLNPIYFAVGYTETEGEYQITIMDSNWKPKDNPNATAEGNLLTVTNDYEPVSQVFEANKTLTGLDLKADQFEFQLVDGEGTVVATAKNDENGKITFPEQSFNQPGTYNFKIREVKGDLGGVTYDDSAFDVQVVVTEGDTGLEVKSVTYLNGPANFENTYVPAETNAVIEARKILEGLELTEGKFKFELLDSDGKVLQMVTNDADGNIAFNAITYDKIGKYEYTIREVDEGLDGITYDSNSYKVKVTVEDDKEGQLIATVNYEDGTVQFTNIYEAGPGSVIFKAQKNLEGKVLEDGQFEFQLVDEDGDVLQTVTNNANGQIIFEEVPFNEVGTYNYTIQEVAGELGGVTYDTTEYPVTVTVVDGEEGHLIATEVYNDGPAVFTNTYTPITPPTTPVDPEYPDPVDPTDPENPDPVDPTDPTDPDPVDPEDPLGGVETLPKTGEINSILLYPLGLFLILLGIVLRKRIV